MAARYSRACMVVHGESAFPEGPGMNLGGTAEVTSVLISDWDGSFLFY